MLCTSGILTPGDEFQYWTDLSQSAEKASARDRAAHFVELFKLIEKVPFKHFWWITMFECLTCSTIPSQKCQMFLSDWPHTSLFWGNVFVLLWWQDYGNLDSIALPDAVELVDVTRDTVDDVWKQSDHAPYPEIRMQRLMDIIGALQFHCILGHHWDSD